MWQMMSCHEFVCLSYVSFKLKMFGMRMALPDTIIYFFVCFDEVWITHTEVVGADMPTETSQYIGFAREAT